MVISLYNISSRYLGSYNKYSISLELTATHLQFNSHAFLLQVSPPNLVNNFVLHRLMLLLKSQYFLDLSNAHFLFKLI